MTPTLLKKLFEDPEFYKYALEKIDGKLVLSELEPWEESDKFSMTGTLKELSSHVKEIMHTETIVYDQTQEAAYLIYKGEAYLVPGTYERYPEQEVCEAWALRDLEK
ncbi:MULTISPECIES: hypothetical protein [unclassified Exiguobacterium]|uniref:hypothetical protein n=1 Tax=unclassified Exiguobacterium TaxID=2644629 RepID=UPI001BE97C2E|nr:MULTISPECIES: hypothetical protein [unclassified Exiguobacterium]